MKNCYDENQWLKKNLIVKLQQRTDIANYKLKTFMICMIMKFLICNQQERYVDCNYQLYCNAFDNL